MRSGCARLFEVEAMRDGRLAGAALTSFGRHLSACRTCAQEAKALDTLAVALADDAPADELRVSRARTRLLAAFDGAMVAGRPHHRARWTWLGGSVAAAAIAFAVLLFARPQPVAPLKVASNVQIQPDVDTIWQRQVDGDAERIVLQRGSLSIHVSHPVGRAARLVVALPDGELEDIGTTFTVTAADGHTTRVAVTDGSVLLRIAGRGPVALDAGQTWTAQPLATTQAEADVPRAEAARVVPHDRKPAAKISGPRLPPPRPADEPASSSEFRALVRSLGSGDACRAAAGFAGYAARYPAEARAEDAAYLQIIALQRCGLADDTRRAAREFLIRHPSAFRRAEVERLSR
jgi:hypothetical protein